MSDNQKNQGALGAKASLANPSGGKKDDKSKKGFLDNFSDNIGNRISVANSNIKALIASEYSKASNRLGVDPVQTVTDNIIKPGIALATGKPKSQTEINSYKTDVSPSKGSESVAPIGSELPMGGFRTNTYANGNNSITFNNKSISDQQVSNLDKTLSYNQRPEVIAGFAKNAALSQARYDDYFAKRDQSESRARREDLSSRLDAQLNKGIFNPNIVDNLQKRLVAESVPPDQKGNSPSFKDINDSERDKARLQFDVNKDQASRTTNFFNQINKKEPSGVLPPLSKLVALGDNSKADYNIEDVVKFSDIGGTDAAKRLSDSQTPEDYISQLRDLGVIGESAIKATQKKFPTLGK